MASSLVGIGGKVIGTGLLAGFNDDISDIGSTSQTLQDFYGKRGRIY